MDNIKAALKAMNDETTTLLHERIKTMSTQMANMTKRDAGKSISSSGKSILTKLLVDNDQRELNDFVSRAQNHFNIAHSTKHSSEYITNDTDEESDQSHDTAEVGDLKALNNRPEFAEWSTSSKSSLLVIRALNHHDATFHTPLWLSQGTQEYVRHLEHISERVVHHIVVNSNEHPSAAFGSMICNIISWDHQFYAEHRQKIVNFMEGPQPQEEKLSLQIELAADLLTAWGAYSKRPVFVILERAERWVQTPGKRVPEHFRAVMKGLKRIVETKGATVKMCMLVEDAFWNRPIREEVAASGLRDRLIDTGCWRQGMADY